MKTYTSILVRLLGKIYENDYHKIAAIVRIRLFSVKIMYRKCYQRMITKTNTQEYSNKA